ncbi:MAG: DoxX family protein [Gammaproteobacteria bacterium]|nr:DoxX family protein [Gammaproteobacteria bacterium]
MIKQVYNDALGKLILRVMLGVMLLFHGVAKIIDPSSVGYIGNVLSSHGLPAFFAYGVYIGEVIAPFMLIFGFHARMAGLLIVANMTVALLLMHSGDVFSVGKHGGWAIELQALYLLSGLVIVFLGSGKIAVKPD